MKGEVRAALIVVAVWIVGLYAWEAMRARFFPQLPPLGDIG